MTATTARLDAIEARVNRHRIPGGIAVTPSDVEYLLTLAREQAAKLERVEAECAATDVETNEPLQADLVARIRAALGDGDE